MTVRFHLSLFISVAASSLCSAVAPWSDVEPFLANKCYSCHGGEQTKGGVDLKQLAADPRLETEFDLWAKVRETIEAGDMPPQKARPLTEIEKSGITGWVSHSLDALAEAKSGDPGPVTMRRLTNAEFDNSLRDLTGQDLHLAREFQPDGGGGEGFANTGDTLFVNPSHLDKYLTAARKLADHATVLPGTGIVFHPGRISLRSPEQVKAQAQQALYIWYQQKAAPHLPKDFDPMRQGDYMLACWKHRHFQIPQQQLAKDMGLNVHFLFNWWRHLNNTEPKSRFLDLTRVAWCALPADEKAAAEGIKTIESGLLSWNDPKRPGEGVQRWQQDSDGVLSYPMRAEVHGRSQVYLCFGDVADGNQGDIALVPHIEVTVGGQKHSYFTWLEQALEAKRKQVAANPPPPDLEVIKVRILELETVRSRYGKHPQPGRQIEPHTLAFAAPAVFTLPLPEAAESLVVETRLDLQNPEADHATIQWTLTTDKPRDVTQVMPGVLTIWKRGTHAAQVTMGEFIAMEQAFADVYERRLQIVAENMHRQTPGIGVYYFDDDQLGQLLGEGDRRHLVALRKDWELVSHAGITAQQQAEYDAALQQHLLHFAHRVWRRPLTDSEKEQITRLYTDSRARELDRESAAREVLVRVLVSPHFLFKAETLPVTPNNQSTEIALSVHEVASRLSYFLWSSIPDEELLRSAENGTLLQPAILAAQATRMLQNPKAEALAREFAGQWLKFSGFENHDAVDAQKFPEFTPELRADMQAEVIAFFTRLVREDRPVSDILAADYSFLNERLARHYGISGISGPELREVKVSQHQRGGILGMGAILTKTSRSHRTSPVLRGDYLYHVVLGFSSPPPPPNIPELKETTRPASLREALMQHRADIACAVCHDRIDPLGFALESFDPIGRHRPHDETGARIDDSGILKNGTRIEGLPGLRDYLHQNQPQVDHQFSRKLLGYALGRQVLPSDKRLLTDMQTSLRENNHRFSTAVLKIITSRQFLQRRNEPAEARP